MTWLWVAATWLIQWLASQGYAYQPAPVPIVGDNVDFAPGPNWRVLGFNPPPREYQAKAIAVQRALSILPSSIYTRVLSKVVIASRLTAVRKSVAGTGEYLPIGGTYREDVIYINANGSPGESQEDKWIPRLLFHELSSLFLIEYRSNFDEARWLTLLPKDFHYSNEVGFGRGQANPLAPSIALLNEGFVTRYAQTTLENDFNMISESLFTGGPDFWKWYEASPALRAKVDFVIEFYQSISVDMNEAFFRDLAH